MTAATVRRIMGAPSEITPMESPSVRAEVWIYRRTTLGPARQVQVGFKTVAVDSEVLPDGRTRVMHSRDEPIFQEELEMFDETVRLLMFNDTYAEQTRSFQRRVTRR
jgi:hypothetical protein